MGKFLVVRNRDSADAYVRALLKAGYRETVNPAQADFLLYDYQRDYLKKKIGSFDGKPKFVYPHTPYSWWIWDGLTTMDEISCNFAVSAGAREGMERYGYSQRVEVCGFPRSPVKPFQATQGKRLLFVPAHPLGSNRRFPTPECYPSHYSALKRIVDMRSEFESVTVRHAYSLKDNGFEDFRNVRGLKFEQVTALTIADSMKALEGADIVVAVGTFGYLSLALGKPTILYGNRTPASRQGYVRNYEKYKDLIDFPRPLEQLTDQEIVNIGERPDRVVEKWKSHMIGQSFDYHKFISIIREFVQ